MADVFISYLQTEREKVALISGELNQLGISVWFDRELIPGKDFSEQIQSEIAEAKSVFVYWSDGADASTYVSSEALYALKKDKLVAAHAGIDVEALRPPFNIQQTTDLSNWNGNKTDPNWIALLKRFEDLLDRPGLAELETARDAGPQSVMQWARNYPDDPLAPSVVSRLLDSETEKFHTRLEQAESDFARLIESGPLQFSRGIDSIKREFNDWRRRLEEGTLSPHERVPDPLKLVSSDGLNINEIDLLRRERDEAFKNVRELSDKLTNIEANNRELRANANGPKASSAFVVLFRTLAIIFLGPLYFLFRKRIFLPLVLYGVLAVAWLVPGLEHFESSSYYYPGETLIIYYFGLNIVVSILSVWFGLEKKSKWFSKKKPANAEAFYS